MINKRFASLPTPFISNSWRSPDVLSSIALYSTAFGKMPTGWFSISEITRNNTSPDGIVIIFDSISSTFSIESYSSTRTYTSDSFGITSAILANVKFMPPIDVGAKSTRRTVGLFVAMGLDITEETVLWVDSMVEREYTSGPNIGVRITKRSGDGGSGGGASPARIPSP
jgi:hypothetical protein